MKKLLGLAMIIAVGLMFGGCATDPYYDTAKTVYKGSKAVYKELGVENEKIEKVAGYAEKYDGVRTNVRIALEGNEADADTSAMVEP